MARTTISFDTVRRIGLALPGVEDSTAYGNLALKAHGKLLACVPTHRSAEPNSLVVKVDFADRAALLAEAPDVYYLTEHYVGYPYRAGPVVSRPCGSCCGTCWAWPTSS